MSSNRSGSETGKIRRDGDSLRRCDEPRGRSDPSRFDGGP